MQMRNTRRIHETEIQESSMQAGFASTLKRAMILNNGQEISTLQVGTCRQKYGHSQLFPGTRKNTPPRRVASEIANLRLADLRDGPVEQTR